MVGEIVFLVTKIPCNSITKRQDQTLNVRVNYTYKGPARTGRLGAVVTQKTAVTEFDEIGSTRKVVYVSLPESTTAVSRTTNITGMPLSGCEAKAGYGIKVYALDLDGKPEWGCLNVLTVTAPPEVYKGTISKKQLEYDGARASIPAYNIPQNKRGLVHIWGRNDMATTQRMGIWWQVKNPAGTVVEEYSTWEAAPYTSPGGAHEFIGGRFTLDKAGTYRIDVALYMNRAAPEIVHRYTGTLCTVAAVAVGISFKVAQKYAEYVFSGASKWCCYYWDPGVSAWVGDGKWHGLTERIAFSKVKAGGRLAVYLLRDTTTSPQYTSPYFTAVDGGIYQYDLYYGTVSKIG